jgi:hypothetical protein
VTLGLNTGLNPVGWLAGFHNNLPPIRQCQADHNR